MKKILIITYYWPPASGPGVQRFLKFVKYFSYFDIVPIILTVQNGSYSSSDESLLNDVPQGVQVYRTTTIEPFRIYNALRGKKGKGVEIGMGNIKNPDSTFKKLANYIRSNYFVPDARVGWNRSAKKKALQIIAKHDINTIITTGPPHSTHLIGLFLKSRIKNINWIADLRDPWVNIYYEKYLSRNKRSAALNQKLENEVLQFADKVVVVSEGMKTEFEDRSQMITIIPNGYDGADLKGIIDPQSEFFVIAYTGNYKVNQNIKSVWNAISQLCEDNLSFAANMKLEFTGPVNQEVKTSISEYKLQKNVQYSGFVKHEVAVQLMKQASLVYLPIPQSENNKMIITGKIFEYMASHTPILSVGPLDGNAADVLNNCERGPMYDYDNIEGIKQRILVEYNHWKNNNRKNRKEVSKLYEKYERKNLTRDYVNLMNS
ncbi:MAG: glycosyltransferase [Saprospiraceae bacterium]